MCCPGYKNNFISSRFVTAEYFPPHVRVLARPSFLSNPYTDPISEGQRRFVPMSFGFSPCTNEAQNASA